MPPVGFASGTLPAFFSYPAGGSVLNNASSSGASNTKSLRTVSLSAAFALLLRTEYSIRTGSLVLGSTQYVPDQVSALFAPCDLFCQPEAFCHSAVNSATG